MKKILITTGGGDCPGLNAVIRGIVKRAATTDYEIWGSIEAFQGILKDPAEIIHLTPDVVAGIHVKGGTILKTTNKFNPLKYPVQTADGKVVYQNRINELASKIRDLAFDAVINIGGDGSQRISAELHRLGIPVIGVPKTIDNDLQATDFTFGFQTAVQCATESFDKLVTTAESHNRVMIMEVMGRDAGWIALHTAIAGGAEICLIPEIPYSVEKLVESIEKRFVNGRGFVNIVLSEGAKPIEGEVFGRKGDVGSEHIRLGGVAFELSAALRRSGCQHDIRETILGHIQRGGTPIAFDRVLSTLFGVKAMELVLEKNFGQMVSYRGNEVVSCSLSDATSGSRQVDLDNKILLLARGLGIEFGD